MKLKNEVQICQICYRTDAFTLGKIDHDAQWHKASEYIRESNKNRIEYFKNMTEKDYVRIELK